LAERIVEGREYCYTVLFEPADGGGYVVTCPALPSVITQGETLEEAREMAVDAIRLVLEDLVAEGQPIPPDTVTEPIKETIRVAIAAA
jgi:antitoxin HicB